MVWTVFPAVEGAAGSTATTRPAQRAFTDAKREAGSVRWGRGAGPDAIPVAGCRHADVPSPESCRTWSSEAAPSGSRTFMIMRGETGN
jgi:hypothetical protein